MISISNHSCFTYFTCFSHNSPFFFSSIKTILLPDIINLFAAFINIAIGLSKGSLQAIFVEIQSVIEIWYLFCVNLQL